MTPGSTVAKNFGCNCDDVANNFGLGFEINRRPTGMQYTISESCPVHGLSRWLVPYVSNSNDAGNITTLVFGKMGG